MPVRAGLRGGEGEEDSCKEKLTEIIIKKSHAPNAFLLRSGNKWLCYESAVCVQTFKTMCFLPYFNHPPLPHLPLPHLRLRLLPVPSWKPFPLPHWGLLSQWFLAHWGILLLLAGAVQECSFQDCICDPSQSRCFQISWGREIKDHLFIPWQNISRDTLRHPYPVVQEVTVVQISYSRRILKMAPLFNCSNGY